MSFYRCSPPPPANHPLFADETAQRAIAASTFLDTAIVGAMFVPPWGLGVWLVLSMVLGVKPPFELDADWRIVVIGALLALPIAPALSFDRFVLAPRRVARAQRWLASLPFPFAGEGYLRAMSQKNEDAALELVLSFAAPVSPDVVSEIAQTYGIDSTPRPSGPATLRLVSPSFRAKHEGGTAHSGSRTWYTNTALHDWFQKRAVPMLVELQRQHGLGAVELEV